MPDLINIGIAPNDHTGDDFRTVCLKLNAYLALLADRNQSLVDQSALTALKAQIDLSISSKLDKTGDASGTSVPIFGGGTAKLGDAIPTLDVPRSEIGNRVIPFRSFVSTGFYSAGDAGGGARYVLGTSSGLMAIQDAAGTWFNLALGGGPVRPGWFGAVAGVADHTAALQACDAAATAASLPYALSGTYSVSTFKPSDGAVIHGAGILVGNATTPTDCILDMTSAVCTASGRVYVAGQYNTNYKCGVWYRGQQKQNVFFQALNITGCLIALRVGSKAYPSGIISESTFTNVSTYGCPVALEVAGVETYLSFIGCIFSGDRFGAPNGSAFLTAPCRAIRCIGGFATVIGGEAIMTSVTDQVLVEMQPLAGTNGEGTRFGEVKLIGVCAETASPLLSITNPDNLTINSTAGVDGAFTAHDCTGYVSNNAAPFLTDHATFAGRIWLDNNDLDFPGTRTQPNAIFTSPNTKFRFGQKAFGKGFKHPIGGTTGGIACHDRRQVFRGTGSGQTLTTSGTTMVFATLDTVDECPFYAAWQSGGVFTAAYAVSEVTFSAGFAFPGAQGTLSILRDGSTRIARAPVVNGYAFVSVTLKGVPAGATFRSFVELTTAPTGGQGDYQSNFLTVDLRNEPN